MSRKLEDRTIDELEELKARVDAALKNKRKGPKGGVKRTTNRAKQKVRLIRSNDLPDDDWAYSGRCGRRC